MAKTTINLPGIIPKTIGNILYAGASGIWTTLAAGTAGQFLQANGAAAPSWRSKPARAYSSYDTNADISTAIPLDNTIPLISEGTEINTAAITLESSASRVRVSWSGFGTCNAGASYIVVAMFRGSTCIQVTTQAKSATSNPFCLSCVAEDLPGSTGPHTYSVRVGGDSGNIRMNGTTAARLFGGAAICAMVVQEVFVS